MLFPVVLGMAMPEMEKPGEKPGLFGKLLGHKEPERPLELKTAAEYLLHSNEEFRRRGIERISALGADAIPYFEKAISALPKKTPIPHLYQLTAALRRARDLAGKNRPSG